NLVRSARQMACGLAGRIFLNSSKWMAVFPHFDETRLTDRVRISNVQQASFAKANSMNITRDFFPLFLEHLPDVIHLDTDCMLLNNNLSHN
ncbi:MAG: hypothetical protein ABIU05_06170, partial [Nitrospirales bacterium]